jgi:hypothetical protein
MRSNRERAILSGALTWHAGRRKADASQPAEIRSQLCRVALRYAVLLLYTYLHMYTTSIITPRGR